MFKWKTSKGNTIHLIKAGITNCYLIETPKTTILVDTGRKKKEKVLISTLSRLLEVKKLDYLILTHTHYDHTENVLGIKQKFNPEIIVHQSEATNLKQGFTSLPRGTNFITDLISAAGNKYARWIGEYDGVKADIEINGASGKELIEGIRIIETPGHTIGSISIIVDNEIALVGDTLFGIFRNKILPPFADDQKRLFESWNKLAQTDCKLFLPAHGRRVKSELLKRELLKK